VLPQHLVLDAELLVASAAVAAITAGHQVVEAHPLADGHVRYPRPDLLHDPRDLVSQGLGQWPDRRGASAIVYVRMANTGSLDLYQDLTLSHSRQGHVLHLQRFSYLHQLNGFHIPFSR
jgi:hypothetical protein